MRRLLGWILFFVGLIVLGWWAKGHQAKDMEEIVTNEATALTDRLDSSSDSIQLQSTVSGRDIEVTGTVPDGEVDGVLEQYKELEGRRVVRSHFDTMPVQSPYLFGANKDSGALQDVSGFAGSAALQEKLNSRFSNAASSDIQLAAGAPEGWGDAVESGATALDALETGSLMIEDQSVTLTGIASSQNAKTAAEEALASMPAGFTTKADITSPEVGPDFTADFAIDQGLSLSGNSTADGTDEAIATTLSAPLVNSSLANDNEGNLDPVNARLANIGSYLGKFDSAKVMVIGDKVEFIGNATPNALSAEDRAAFEAGFAEGDMVNIIEVNPEEGSERANVLNGETEFYYASTGVWGPYIEPVTEVVEPVEVSVESCDSDFVALMADQTINFVTASAELDGSSEALLDRIAEMTNLCLASGDMTLEIGGHTDSDGSDDANLSLSQARADTVRQALAARGVDTTDITTLGYGETQPVADNDTPEGKAKNRRTSFIWTKKN